MSVEKTERDKKLEAEFLELLEASFDYTPPERGEIRNATILQIDPKGDIIVDLGSKQDGIVPSQDTDRLDPDYRAKLAIGEQVPVYIMNPRDPDGNLIVSINQGLQQYDWEAAKALLNTDDVVEVTVTGRIVLNDKTVWYQLDKAEAAPKGTSAAEELGKEIFCSHSVGTAALLQAFFAILVVYLSFLRVAQDFVGL